LISVVRGLYPVFDKDAFFSRKDLCCSWQITVRAQTVSVYINYSSCIRIHDMLVPLYIFVNIVSSWAVWLTGCWNKSIYL